MGQDFYNQLQVLENTKAEDSGGIRFPDNTHVGVEVDYEYESEFLHRLLLWCSQELAADCRNLVPSFKNTK